MRSTVLFFTAVLMSSGLCGAQQSTSRSELPKIGDKAPGWTDLAGTDGKKHSLAALKDQDVIVVCFTCNTCPYAVDYEDRLVALHRKYTDSGQKVRLIAINANTVPGDRMEDMQKRAKDKEFKFSYLWDETQDVARKWGAIYTPEFFVLNKERKIIYRGAMDDSTRAKDVRVKHVELAVEAALAGKTPEVTKTGARGCAIRFKRRRR